MAKVVGKNIILNQEEATLVGEGKEYEFIPNDKGIFLMIDKDHLKEKEGKQVCVSVPALEEEKQQVIGLIKSTRLSDLVEGKFEVLLNEGQKKALLQLVTTGKVFVFKLNETYKKGVYRVKEDSVEEKKEKKESEYLDAPEKPFDKYTLEADGFLIIKGKDSAQKASYEYEKQIKEGHLRGIRSFDGNYYLLQTSLLDEYLKKIVISFGTNNTQSIEELAKSIKASLTLTRIICEFLKDEGELMERKKGQYTYIK